MIFWQERLPKWFNQLNSRLMNYWPSELQTNRVVHFKRKPHDLFAEIETHLKNNKEDIFVSKSESKLLKFTLLRSSSKHENTISLFGKMNEKQNSLEIFTKPSTAVFLFIIFDVFFILSTIIKQEVLPPWVYVMFIISPVIVLFFVKLVEENLHACIIIALRNMDLVEREK